VILRFALALSIITLTLGERAESPGFTPGTGSASYTVTLR